MYYFNIRGIAETILENGPNFCGKADVNISGPDLIKVERISERFDIKLELLISEIYDLLRSKKLWNAIERLATEILRNDPEPILGEATAYLFKHIGFIDYIEDSECEVREMGIKDKKGDMTCQS